MTRGGKTLPIADVPNLQPNDRLCISRVSGRSIRSLLDGGDFSARDDKSPAENWFTRAETWNRQVRTEGIVVTVPPDAQQSLIFLAPRLAGISAVCDPLWKASRVFSRASQDLNQASLDRTRSDKYLADVKATSESDPKALHDRSVCSRER